MKLPINAASRKKRLKLWLGLFFLLFSAPVYFLIQTVYRQLQNEALFQSQQQVEQLSDRLDSALLELIASEQMRPSTEYSFFNVLENPLLDSSAINFSPLSKIPPQTNIPGIIGYFEIEPDGTFHIPALPELEQNNHSGLSATELQNRLALKKRLQHLLAKEETSPPTQQVAETEQRFSADEERAQYVVNQLEEKVDADSPKKIQAKLEDARGLTEPPAKQRLALAQNRKEKAQLPNQSMASSFFKRAPRPAVNEPLLAEAPRLREAKLNDAGDIEILSFESEITPLQLLIVKTRYFCFFRHVWHNNARYTQGFLVDIEAFFDAVTRPIFSDYGIDSIDLRHQGKLLARLRLADTATKQQSYNRPLPSPFEHLELLIRKTPVNAGNETLLVDLLAASIAAILIGGLLFFYLLLRRQIDLSQQQQNFISAVSHELKTPLTSIRMYGEMLRSGWVNDDRKKQQYYDFIFFESERLSRLITNVLQLARIDNRSHNLEPVALPAVTLLQRIPAKIEAQIVNSGFTLNLVFPEQNQTLAIKVDEDAFFQIIINLVDNALKFAAGAEKAAIDIGFRPTAKGKSLEFYVRDYGPGITKPQQDKIFRLFYRSGDELTRSTPGTGIGLALVKQLAGSMRATVGVVNRQPGAEFQIRFAAFALATD